jgi:hypothetical protein
MFQNRTGFESLYLGALYIKTLLDAERGRCGDGPPDKNQEAQRTEV